MKAEDIPCPACGVYALRIELKFRANPLGTFSISGAQPKIVAYEWPYLVCGSCGVEAPAKDENEE